MPVIYRGQHIRVHKAKVDLVDCVTHTAAISVRMWSALSTSQRNCTEVDSADHLRTLIAAV